MTDNNQPAKQAAPKKRRAALKPASSPANAKADALDFHIEGANAARDMTEEKIVKVTRYCELVAYIDPAKLAAIDEADAAFARVHIDAAKQIGALAKNNGGKDIAFIYAKHYHQLVTLAVAMDEA